MTGEKSAAAVGPVVVELTGLVEPATFDRVPDALEALWESIRLLPLGSLQLNWFKEMLIGEDALLRAEDVLRRGEGLVLPFTLADRPHVLTMQSVGREAPM
ncbi:hypothetical protein ACIGXM_21520 [Kitasatospora sp. NPDC052896]|uniref:hypothetical protein n=1 Tax=Kitasatospora sp. NPDC052896 TaxID=3364061 RepID=UPI0037CAC018